jgi:hypothetical protein
MRLQQLCASSGALPLGVARMGRWPADNVGPTKHPSAFRLNKKELAEIADAAAKVEADALEQGAAAEEATVMGEAKKRELTKQKQEERWRRSSEKTRRRHWCRRW